MGYKERMISFKGMALEQFGKFLKMFSFTTLALATGLLAGKFVSGYTRADAVDSARPKATPGSATAVTAATRLSEHVEPAVIDPRAGDPTISARDFERMTKEIQRATWNFPGNAAIFIKNLESGQEWTHNANQMMTSASLIKVPVMIGVFEKIKKGELRLDQTVVLTKAARKSGSGHLKWRRNGERFTIRELLVEMMALSDNIAQEMLIQLVGLNFLQERFPAFGLTLTNITRQGLSLSPRTRVENYTTAREMGRLLENIYRKEKFGSESSEQMIELMKGAKYNDRLTKYLPRGWTVAHKTGLLRRACHDVGIVYSPAGNYIICVLTSAGPSYRTSKQFISKVGAITFRYFESPSADVASSSGAPSRPAFKRAS